MRYRRGVDIKGSCRVAVFVEQFSISANFRRENDVAGVLFTT